MSTLKYWRFVALVACVFAGIMEAVEPQGTERETQWLIVTALWALVCVICTVGIEIIRVVRATIRDSEDRRSN